MIDRMVKVLLILNLILLVVVLVRPSVALRPGASPPSVTSAPKDNEELARLSQEDQSDRTPEGGKEIDWAVVGPRDKAREMRVKELYAKNMLKTGADYYRAAMILQHSQSPEDYLLAHELCIVAISRGEEQAKWLAAASEDRFLMEIGRPQRFGTQYWLDGQRYVMDEGVTDELRRMLDVPPVASAKK